MELKILGPLELHGDKGMIALGGRKQRGVLAALVLKGADGVSVPELVELLWPEVPPSSALKNLQKYVWSLRSAFEAAGCARRCIEKRPSGYRLYLETTELDWERFCHLVTSARRYKDSDPRKARSLLDHALSLWRGPAFADLVADLERAGVHIAHFEEARWRALEDRIDAALDMGDHQSVVGELQGLISASPLRERLYAQLMLALYRSHRQADALEVYRALKALLVGELGIDPSAAVEDLHLRILNADPGLAHRDSTHIRERTVPRQLPAVTRGFVGRSAELAELTRTLQQDADAYEGLAVYAIDGMAGVGKTTLAVQCAHRITERFQDGQLFVNLRGFDASGQPMTPDEALHGFLEGLGVDVERIPKSLDSKSALYRSLLADKRVLIVLDNVRDAEQVRPLLPGTRSCAVLITARTQPGGLMATEGVQLISLKPFTDIEARELLTVRLSPQRAAREPDMLAELIDLCARLPLALSIIAAHVTTHPSRTLESIVADLHDVRRRLRMLDIGDPVANVRTVFSWSYRSLRPSQARLFRLLGVHPGPDISIAAVASLAGIDADQAERALTELVRTHLIDSSAPGRYEVHDLLRVYAGELADVVDSETQRHAAVHRMLDHYLHTAHAAALLLDPTRDPIELTPVQAGVTPESLSGQLEALQWYESEHPALMMMIRLADAHGFDRHAWQLPWTLVDFLDRRGHWQDLMTTQDTALRAVQRCGDPYGEARIHRGIARAHAMENSYDTARSHLDGAMRLHRQLGDLEGQARIHRDLGWLSDRQGLYEDALLEASEALRLFRVLGHRRGQADVLNTVGWSYARLGRHEEAIDHCEEALGLMRDFGDRHGEADTWDSLGYAYHLSGEHATALSCYQRAVGLYREMSDPYYEADTLTRVGDTHRQAGDVAAACEAWSAALALLDTLRHADADRVRSLLKSAEDFMPPRPTVSE